MTTPAWQAPGQADFTSPTFERRKPSLRVVPSPSAKSQEFEQSSSRLPISPSSPGALLTPTTPKSPNSQTSLKQKMHFRMRSISGKTPLTPAKKWERLSEKDKSASERFVRNAVSMCGLAGFSWTKTHDYILVATDLPLNPQYILRPDEPIASENDQSSSASSSRRPSTGQLLAPETASRPGSATPSTLSTSSSTTSLAPDIKPVLTRVRLLFERMQQERDPIYMYYINLPNNNLKKMHAHAVAQHRAAVLRVERSSLMDAIEFDKKAERSRGMEMAVAKLRFEMELDVEAAIPDDHVHVSNGVLTDVRKAEEATRRDAGIDGSIKSARSTASLSSPPSHTETSDMRTEASNNNRVSGVPTIVTTVSDMLPLHMRQLSMGSNLDRPASPASAKSEGHVQSRDTWQRLQEARHRFSRRSRSRVDGVSQPGEAQRVDERGFFSPRPS